MFNHVHFLNDGNPTRATATCIQKGGGAYSKRGNS